MQAVAMLRFLLSTSCNGQQERKRRLCLGLVGATADADRRQPLLAYLGLGRDRPSPNAVLVVDH
jgi:hypothetical protein